MTTSPRRRRPSRSLVVLLWALTTALLGTSLAGTAAAADGDDVHLEVASDPADPVGAWRTYLDLMLVPSVPSDHRPTDASPQATRTQACPPSRCRDYRVPVPADVNITSNLVRVVLPRGYSAPANRRKRYPVVFAYNGALSPYVRWTEATELLRITSTLPAIFVMPEGGVGKEAGMFSDWADGSFQWETYHTEVVTSWVDRKFRTTGKRAALGASMGGLGALAYPARHPGLYQAAFTVSGAVDTNLMVGNTLPPAVAELVGIAPPDLTRVWGNPVLRRATWEEHNPVHLAPRLKGVKVLVASGTGSASTTSETGHQIHSGYTEQVLWSGHRTFLAALTAAGVPYEAWVRRGGMHNWPWFNAPLRWGLPKLVAALR